MQEAVGTDWAEYLVSLPFNDCILLLQAHACLKRAQYCCSALLAPQAALQAAQQAGGGVIFLPAGTYVLSRPLVISRSNVVVRGEGQVQTTIHIPVSLSDVYQGTWSLGANSGEFTNCMLWGHACADASEQPGHIGQLCQGRVEHPSSLHA